MADERDKEKAMAGMLRQKSAWPSTPAGTCPDVSILAAYFDRALTAAEMQHCEAHFSVCLRCQEQLATLARAEVVPSGRPAEAKKPAFAWIWDWRWLAPAGAAAAAVALWVVMRPEPFPVSAPPPAPEIQAKLEQPSKEQALSPDQKAPESGSGKEALSSSRPEAARRVAVKAPQIETSGLDETAKSKSALTGATTQPGQLTRAEAPTGKAAPAKPAEIEVAEGGRVTLPPPQAAPPAQAVQAETAKEERQVAVADRAAAANLQALQAQKQAAAEVEKKVVADQATVKTQETSPAAGRADKAAPSKREEDAAAARFETRARSGVAGGLAQVGEAVIPTPNQKVLWRVGRSGTIERSQDTGKTWLKQTSPTQEDLLAGSAPAQNICWLGGKKGVLLRTTDGRTWEVILSPTHANILSIQAQDASNVVLRASDGRIFETRDAGRTWQAR